ncbi:uncharacterized protein [Epargyreus clarus]|uniref:uncharacterized protein isoform X2 n=1 Tax=Epargyreus clarus TaxID=520877 RepID=UPI003C2DEAFF
MPACVFIQCKNNSRHKNEKHGITFHLFPKCARCRTKWIAITKKQRRQPEWAPTINSRLQPETASSPTEDSQSRDDACCSSTSLRDSEERASGNSICCWQPEHYFLFISLYKEQERLWNPHNPAYREVGARASALERLAQGMGFSDFTITDVEKKIRYIRGTYMNELNRIEESLCSGSDTIYKPVVPWFDALDSFLRNVHTGANNSHDTLQNEIKVEFSCEDNDEDVEQDFVHLHPEPTSWAAAERAERLAESAAKRARDGAGEGDEFAVFARHVATQLRALPLAFALEAQETIQSALTRYRLKTIRK